MRGPFAWLRDLKTYLTEGEAGGLRDQLVRGSTGSFLIKGAQTFLALGLMVTLARLLGADGYGIYAYVLALVEIVAIPARSGLRDLTVREVAAYREKHAWGLMQGVLKFGLVGILLLGVVVGAVAWSTKGWFTGGWSAEKINTLGWGLLLLPLMALSNFAGAALRGLKNIVQGLLPDSILRRAGLLIVCGGVWWLSPESLTPSGAMSFHALAAGGAFLAGTWMFLRVVPDQTGTAPAEYRIKEWLASLGPLSLISGMQMINSRADIVMLGIFRPSSEVGIYRIAAQGGLLVAFGLKAVNMAVAPHFSSLWASEDIERLQRVVTVAARAALFVALPVALVFIVGGDLVLEFVFGEEYASGHAALAIISVGQVINTAIGSVMLLLNMTGHERLVVRGLAVAASSNIVLNLLLIPVWGMTGAAIATVVTFGIWNFGLWWFTKRRLNIDTIAFRGTVQGASR